MATQCERVFSAAKRTLTPERYALGMKVIEACGGGGYANSVSMTPRTVIRAQFVTALVNGSAQSGVSEEDVD
jgi:hypothetical protein